LITRVEHLKDLSKEDYELAKKFSVAVWCGEFGDDPLRFDPPDTESFNNFFKMVIAKSHDIITAAKKIGIKIEM
jgi:hypothetical protein